MGFEDDVTEPSIGKLQPPWEAAHSVAGWLQWTDDPPRPEPYVEVSFDLELTFEDDGPSVESRYRIVKLARGFIPWGPLRIGNGH